MTGFSDFFAATHTDGLVILHNGALVHESYANGMTASDPHICMSVSKSMLGLLAGTLAKSGDLDLSSNAATYIPELTQTAFANATVQQLLDMRTGVTFDEDYLATAGPIIEYRKSTNWNPLEPGQSPTDLRSFLLTLVETDGPHGGRFDYKSPCTDLLGWVIERATGRRFADLFSDLIWKPMGAETPAAITVDRLGAPRTAGGMSITTRDLARVGQMVCEGGWGIVPEDWINDIVENGDPDAWAHGSFAEEFSGLEMHYRSKWYVLRGKDPVLFCLGIHGQNLLVDRKAQVVLARHASGPDPLDLRSEKLTIKLFEAVRNRLGRS
ncbi:MAG: serine hydrolase [Pseudomonadota bacterium]